MEHNSTFPIKQNELDMLRDEATSYIKSVQWEQGQRAKNRDKDAADESILLYLSRAKGNGGSEVTSVSKTILELKKRLLPESIAIPVLLNQTLYTIQEGLTLGIWIKDSYYDASGLSSLAENRSALDNAGKREYESKMQTATAFMLFATAYKILHDLQNIASDDLSVMKNKFAGIPEVSLMTPLKGISCALFYYDKYLGHPEIIKSDKDVADFTVVFFEALIDEIQLRKSSLEYTETITDRTYKLENSEFAVSGWDNVFQGAAKSVEFNKIQFEQIVGNRDAKHFARRLTERMLSYDFEAKKNPFQELGGFMPVFMGYGIPGTGKSMLIAAIATRLKEHCDHLDIPFLFHPMPDTLISTFQGGSAEKMVEWMKPLQDPSRLIFAPIDDAENNLQERTAQGVSAGVKEVIGVFLRYTEGAYAVNYGNSSIGLFTNLPEMLDKAVISRVQGRFKIDGARTEHDFLDQDHLWWRKFDDTMPDFVNMQGPENYAYLQDQGLAKNMGEILKLSDKPTEERVLAAYDKVEHSFDTNQHLFYANLYKEIQKIFPFFSSRDVRNIQSAISLRLTDFDLEEDWFENPDIYFKKDYETKFNMLRELMRANMKGLDFAEIRRQEVVRYLDNVATIADTDFKRKVDARINQMNIEQEARDQFGKLD
ncbi:AAA family ATPase [Psychroserpens sp.]|uniref:AAA family ATPase n=1 Tax=Psychroserpens sp. TaxID=2020870 RepID=UPI001B02EFB5|nr:AAA family ATPase [Psychroserpens sp.]MBO6606598.1 AAA family ATPase [Psychroserpens sp.]MBO6653302.1 AAA family ATPase [Psychroserpens sp.]MBO6680671.1 AAA family ATPase [Psychroserpens sp.]MBO6750371.1 AAA family ATPase [Psychroserpens sp.]MBO6914853.1 AAA family ATPase [Psychroserpens sp.]